MPPEAQQMPTETKKPSKLLKIILALIVLLVIAGLAAFAMRKQPGEGTQHSTGVTIKTIELPTKFTEDYPDLKVQKGHYLLNSTGEESSDYALNYDGNEVYEGSTTAVLSDNGLHYGYTVGTKKDSGIYIDGKSVATIKSPQVTIQAVSDDGSQYIYTTSSANANGEPVRNGLYRNKELLHTTKDWESIFSVKASGDLSAVMFNEGYECSHRGGGCGKFRLILNGKVIDDGKQGGEYAMQSFDISQDGKQNIFTRANDDKNYKADLVVNGVEQGEYLRGGGDVYISNSGYFTFVGNQDGIFVSKVSEDGAYDNLRIYPVSPNGGDQISINDDASHTFLWYRNGNSNFGYAPSILQLDGNNLDYANKSDLKAAELDGNTLYLYLFKPAS